MPKYPTAAPRPPCPNPPCTTSHVVRNGSLNGRQRYHCRGCDAWFGDTHGPPMYRLRPPPEAVGRALLVVMRRGSLRAAEEVTGHTDETISHWRHLAAAHADALTHVLVRDLGLSTLEVDEFWSFVQRRTDRSHPPPHRRPATAGAV